MTADIIENTLPSDGPRKKRSKLWVAIKWLFLIGCVFGVFILIAAFVFYIRATKDLPTLEALAEYKPPVMTRVHAGDGKLITEFSKQARVFVPVETIPKKLQLAFVAAEDKRFYSHNGWDPIGLTRAALSAPAKKLKKQRVGGTSTITQQVAKNFLVGDDYSMTRKIREIAIARRMEEALSKDDIIELYLNEIYFGRGAYGVAAASLKHFGKPMDELTLAQMTYLASVPKGPSNYRLDDPKGYKKAKNRQSYILGRMREDGYITKSEADAAKSADLNWVSRLEGAEFLAAEYFVEEARKKIYKLYGQDELYSGGLSIRTTLDTKMQLAGRRALRRGIERFDRRHGYRGPLTSWDSLDDWKKRLTEFEGPKDVTDWRVAVVLDVSDKQAKLGFAPKDAGDQSEAPASDVNTDDKGVMKIADIDWAAKALPKGRVTNKPSSVKQIVKAGDVILVQRKAAGKDGTISTEYNLRQVPKVNGGLIAMDPHTGRVLSLIGGYSFEQSEFNRATQANRQPGSAFKPFVYAAALQNGYTPASQVLDAPFVIERQDVECEENELGALELRGQQEDRNVQNIDEDIAEDDECERFYKPSNYNAGK
ncbi:MAG: transglycosylase domain-containing protein, partial [Litorimonas sp.]